jgi:chromate transporter
VRNADRQPRLGEIAGVFLRLGTTAFGGPAAHVAMMETEIVRRRGWLSHEQFLDFLGIANLIPGPNSTEVALQVGLARGGWPGLLVAGACFITPAALIVGAIAWAYVRFGALPQVAGILQGLYPVVVAIIAHALWQLARSAVKSIRLAALAVTAVAAILAGVHEVLVLAGIGVVCAVLAAGASRERPGSMPGVFGASFTWLSTAGAVSSSAPVTLASLFLTFLKIGSVLFGSGYVLVAFLRADFVERLGWLTEQQLLDAVAVGQITPGPLFTTATFIGFVLGGTTGGIVATLGIFLPAFVVVAAVGPFVPALRRSPIFGSALDGVNVASLALVGIVTWQLAISTLRTPIAVASSLVCLLLLVRYAINTTWLVLAGAAAGWLLYS